MTAPVRTPPERIERFLYEKEGWMRRHLERIRVTCEYPPVSEEQIEKMKRQVFGYAQKWETIMGVHASGWTLRDMKTRWGSCSARGNLNFNYQLYYLPQELLDYVVVHELAHRRYMNHSAEFWKEVERYYPDYRNAREKLKERRLVS